MARYVFHIEVKPDKLDELRELNERYGEALSRAAGGIDGLSAIEKWIVGTDYVELVDYDGEFADFGKQIAADPEVREFLRAVNDCFVTPLREMDSRRMELLQSLADEPAQAA